MSIPRWVRIWISVAGTALVLIGSTGAGLRLTMNGELETRIVGIVLSPVDPEMGGPRA